MRRRDLLVGLWAVATLRSARAQQSGKVHRIAYVRPAGAATEFTETAGTPSNRAMLKELRRLGYIEGQNLLIERFSGEGRAAHYLDLAQDVVRRKPDVIISSTTFLTLDFKAATTTIPIVGIFGYHRGRHQIGSEQWDKRAQLFHQVVPHLTKLGALETRQNRDKWEADRPEIIIVGGWRSPMLVPHSITR